MAASRAAWVRRRAVDKVPWLPRKVAASVSPPPRTARTGTGCWYVRGYTRDVSRRQPLGPPADRRRLLQVALGEQPAELVIRGARVLDGFTAELLPETDVAVAGGRIAFVGTDGGQRIGPETAVIEAEGRALLPGLIEGHTHVFAQAYRLEEFLRYAVPGGTTTVITEITELGSVLGYEGLRQAVDGLAGQPIKLLATLPPLVSLLARWESIAPTLEEYRTLLARPEVLGLGELYWGSLVRGDERLLGLVEATLEAGKVAEGHTAGARGAKLQAYACAGLSSCHEPITAEEGIERLRLGMTFMAREGAIRRDLEAIAPIWREVRDLRRMTLCTDSVTAEDLLERGSLEHCVRKAIALGLEPARAIQMVTLNVAEHFGIDADLGAIAPGRCADLMLVPDERTIEPSLVLSDGRVVARDGELVAQPRPVEWSRRSFVTVRWRRVPRPSDFAVRTDAADGSRVRVRAIECVSPLVTQEREVELPVVGGQVRPDPAAGVLKIAAFDRVLRSEARFVGFVKGYGLRAGAVASTMTWDSPCMLAIGADDRDLALAACRMYDIQGGAAVFLNGELLAELAAPLGGFQSQLPIPAVAELEAGIRAVLHDLGCPWPHPLLTLNVMTTAAIPFFRVTDQGYARLRTGEEVGLVV